MAAHRYWRLHISASASGQYATIGEIVYAESPGGAQAATGGTVSASSELAGNEAVEAFDGTVATGNGWVPNTSLVFPHWITYDMGSGNDIDVVEMRITSPAGVTLTHYPTAMVLLYSDDGLNWYVQRGWNGLVFTALETKTLDATPLNPVDVYNRVVARKDIRHSNGANSGAPTIRKVVFGPTSPAYLHGAAPRIGTPYTGSYYIAGSTTVLGEPYARRVDLVDQKSGLLVRSVHTKNDGQFLFEYVGPGPWTLVGVDNSAEQNSVIFAHVPPEPM